MSKELAPGLQKFRENYGVKSPLCSPELVERRRHNKMSKRDIAIEEHVKDNMRKYVKDNKLTADIFCKLLHESGFKYDRNVKIGDEVYDVLVDSVLFNVCPSETHNVVLTPDSEYGIYSGKHCDSYINADDNGYRLIHVFDWDDPIVIVSNLSKPHIVSGTRIVEPVDRYVTQAFKFQHNIINKQYQLKTGYGLFEDEELVAIGMFGKSRRKQYDWELIEYIEDSIHDTPERISCMVKGFLKQAGGKSVVCYIDNAKQYWRDFVSAGFIREGDSRPIRFWSRGIERRSDTAFATSPKDILYEGADTDIGLSTYLLQQGWLPVYDCGKTICVWEEDK